MKHILYKKTYKIITCGIEYSSSDIYEYANIYKKVINNIYIKGYLDNSI